LDSVKRYTESLLFDQRVSVDDVDRFMRTKADPDIVRVNWEEKGKKIKIEALTKNDALEWKMKILTFIEENRGMVEHNFSHHIGWPQEWSPQVKKNVNYTFLTRE